ncbi:hypothetical protein V6N13_064120 [Hibiscus sabdariffa]|uniref:Uncharacterized protein n=1 Tax=Hibiscus sabdariffa TaxID=183260 RepID=A0ABR2R246_9ROSI
MFQHRQNKATSRWRGGPHGSIPCKQIGVVASTQAIHAAQRPGHLEVASAKEIERVESNKRKEKLDMDWEEEGRVGKER